ncbi:hypothetical protein L1887_59652 [Cichorium endivia]|nr:hypothetical protein L1887_59652 [Cichorium endivia]
MCCGEAYLLDEVCEAGLCGLVVEHELLLVLVGDLDPLECVCGDGLGGDVRQVHAGHGRLGGQAREQQAHRPRCLRRTERGELERHRRDVLEGCCCNRHCVCVLFGCADAVRSREENRMMMNRVQVRKATAVRKSGFQAD